MVAKKKTNVSARIVAKARQVLEFAQQRAAKAADWIELSNALFGLGGKATELFLTESERTAFCRTEEYKQILTLMNTLPHPPVKGFVDMIASANGANSVRLPRSVHIGEQMYAVPFSRCPLFSPFSSRSPSFLSLMNPVFSGSGLGSTSPDAFSFRVRVPGRRVQLLTLVTTLVDPKRYPKEVLARLYEKRWGVETNLRHLKQTLPMDILRCETWRGIWKELLVFVMVYNLVRRGMLAASRQQGVDPERISFVDALRWLREARRGEAIPRLKINPQRRGRVEPRVKKRRPKQYDLMTRPRAELRHRLLHNTAPPQEVAA